MFNVSVGWRKNRSDGLKKVCLGSSWSQELASALHNNNHFLLLSQLMQILSMGFQNKFYNASKKDPDQTSGTSVAEYRVNVSSDTPHWYIRDYLARVSRHYDIRAIEVDGNYNLEMGLCQFSLVNKYCC